MIIIFCNLLLVFIEVNFFGVFLFKEKVKNMNYEYKNYIVKR